MTKQSTRISSEKLIREFQQILSQDAVDAHRNAFTALAVRRGWPKARIGRYLGISRARVGQKVEKLEHYAATARVPTIKQVMADAEAAAPVRGTHDQTIEWDSEDWADLTFARSLIDMLV